MKRLIEFPLEDGGSIVVESHVMEPAEGMVRAGRPVEIATKASQTFEDAFEKIKPAATAIITKLRSLSDPPDEMEVEFGVKMNAEVGVFIAAVGAEANYKVTLKWKAK